MNTKNRALAWLTEKSPFPKKLRMLMGEREVTQEMLAKHLDVTRQTVSLYANGQAVPDIYKAQLIAEYFGVNIGYLLSNTEVTAFYNNEQFENYCREYGGDTYFNICTLLNSLTADAQQKVLDRIHELKEIPKYNESYCEWLADSKGGEK